jgi:curved DNA-binding protein CbpA
MSASDPYAVLGLEPGASLAAAGEAYRRLALQFHPDKKGGDRARFDAIGAALRLLEEAQPPDAEHQREWAMSPRALAAHTEAERTWEEFRGEHDDRVRAASVGAPYRGEARRLEGADRGEDRLRKLSRLRGSALEAGRAYALAVMNHNALAKQYRYHLEMLRALTPHLKRDLNVEEEEIERAARELREFRNGTPPL